jgi:hypothetical protein
MPLSKPFPHMRRPGAIEPFRYLQTDSRMRNFFASYEILKRDLRRVLEFVEPHPKNLMAFSHRIFELLLRAATEVEAICRLIFESNKVSLGRDANILRFSDLDEPMQLSFYKVIHAEFDLPHMRPFAAFSDPDRSKRSPAWYRAYNSAKHNRGDQFEMANLENALTAIAGVYVLLVAQVGPMFDTTVQYEGPGFRAVSNYLRSRNCLPGTLRTNIHTTGAFSGMIRSRTTFTLYHRDHDRSKRCKGTHASTRPAVGRLA